MLKNLPPPVPVPGYAEGADPDAYPVQWYIYKVVATLEYKSKWADPLWKLSLRYEV